MSIDLIEIENKITPKHIVFFSLIIIVIVISFSIYDETRSQQLPALVKTETISISSISSGIAGNYKVTLNEPVQQGQLLFELGNPQLLNQLINLKNERSKYEEVINSATSGDHLKLKLNDIEKELLKQNE